jgi:hypothetical protein
MLKQRRTRMAQRSGAGPGSVRIIPAKCIMPKSFLSIFYSVIANQESTKNQLQTQIANQSRATATVKKSPLDNSKIPKLCVPIIAGHKPKKLWPPSMARQTRQ